MAQPNNQIRLFIVAPSGRREKLFNQLIRPSFHALADQCEFLSFEMVDDAVGRIESLKGGQSVRVSGLLEGERFQLYRSAQSATTTSATAAVGKHPPDHAAHEGAAAEDDGED